MWADASRASSSPRSSPPRAAGQRRHADRGRSGATSHRHRPPARCRATSRACAAPSTRPAARSCSTTTPATGSTSIGSRRRRRPVRGAGRRGPRPTSTPAAWSRPATRSPRPLRCGAARRSSSSSTRAAALAQAAALEERRLAVLEERIDADLALGRHSHLVGELSALVAEHPLREGLHAKLALALYRSGRQADALRALADAGPHAARGARPRAEPPAARARGRHPRPRPLARRARLGAGERVAPTAGERQSRSSVGTTSWPTLLAAYDEAADDARFVVLEGDPGIGKTRLADELAAVAAGRGSLAVWGRSNECGAAPALWPWLPVLRAGVPHVGDVPAPLSEVLAGEAPLLRGPGRRRAVRALRRHRRAPRAVPARRHRVVVLLDDLQWADVSLARAAAVPRRPAASAGCWSSRTVRSLEVGPQRRRHRRARRHRPPAGQPAPPAARPVGVGHRRAARRAGRPSRSTAEISARIHDRAEGNPFYAIELARLLDEAGWHRRRGAGDRPRRDPPAPHACCPPTTVDLLAVAAVVGRDVDVPLVARAAGLDLGECLDRLDPAADHRLLVEASATPGALRFSHALVREVLLDGLTPLRRARLHLQVADAIERRRGRPRRRRGARRAPLAGRAARRRRPGRRCAGAGRRGRHQPRRLRRGRGPARACRPAAARRGLVRRGAAGRAVDAAAAARGDAGDALLLRHRPRRARTAPRSWPPSGSARTTSAASWRGPSGRRSRPPGPCR